MSRRKENAKLLRKLPYDDIRMLSQTSMSNIKWDTLSAAAWKYLAAVGHCKIKIEEIQLVGVAKSPDVFQHLQNPSEKVKRLHEMKWVL